MRKVIALTLALLTAGCITEPLPEPDSRYRFPPQYIRVIMEAKLMNGLRVISTHRMFTDKANCAWAIVEATISNQARAADDYQRIIVTCWWPPSNKKV